MMENSARVWNLTENGDKAVPIEASQKIISTFWLGIVLALIVLYFSVWYESRTWKFLKNIPGPPRLPILGNALEFRNTKTAFKSIEKWPETYGDRIRFTVGRLFSAFVLINPDDIEKVLNSTQVINKANNYSFLEPWLGTGLLTSSDKKWHSRRKLLTPAFHFKILDTFHCVFNEQAQILVDILKAKRDAGAAEVEMYALLSRCALDIICETAMGKRLNSQTDLKHPYAVAVDEEASYVYKRMTSPWVHSDFLFKYSQLGRKERKTRKIIHDFVNEVIRERKVDIKARMAKNEGNHEQNQEEDIYLGSRKKFAFLDLMLNLQLSGEANLTDDDIQEETSTIMFGGHDTTAASLAWTMFRFGSHQDIQDKARAELDQVFGEDRSRPVTAEDLSKLKYLECCIKESLRLHPPVPSMGRKTDQDFQLDKDTLVPAGIELVVSPWLIHRNPKFFPNPRQFDPSRHFIENSSGRHPYAFLPFSAGPRNCIGQKYAMPEMKIVLAHLLRNFRFHIINPRRIVGFPEIVLRPKNGVFFSLESR